VVAHRNTTVFSTLMALARWTYGRVPWMRWESFCQYWKGWKWPRSVHALGSLGHLRTQDASMARWWAIRKRYWMIFHVVFGPRGFLNHVRQGIQLKPPRTARTWGGSRSSTHTSSALKRCAERKPISKKAKSRPQIGTVTRAKNIACSASSALHHRLWKEWHVWQQRFAR